VLVSFTASTFRTTRWYEYAIRFAIGGVATVLAGVIADECGPAAGGLFLAFPAIFAAAATLIQQHEQKKKRKHGLDGRKRASQAVALDATGAAIGSFGLLLFAYFVSRTVARLGIALTLGIGVVLWTAINLTLWGLWRLIKARLARVRKLRRQRHKVESR
jgi:Protein of unknown function (DUF3147)